HHLPFRPPRDRSRSARRPGQRGGRVSSASAEADMSTRPRERTFLDRALAVVPIVGLGLLVISFYCVEAWTRKTPWLFTDEIEWTQISRAIASTGHAARRGEPTFF